MKQFTREEFIEKSIIINNRLNKYLPSKYFGGCKKECFIKLNNPEELIK